MVASKKPTGPRDPNWIPADEYWAGPSRSQLKREAESVRKLSEQLVDLHPAELARLPLDDDVRTEVHQARGFSRSARARQIRHIAKLLRDRNTDGLHATLGSGGSANRATKAADQRAEAWRTKLLSGGDAALAELIDAFPHAERQSLRQLVRKATAQREHPDHPAPKRASLHLLRAIRALMAVAKVDTDEDAATTRADEDPQ